MYIEKMQVIIIPDENTCFNSLFTQTIELIIIIRNKIMNNQEKLNKII